VLTLGLDTAPGRITEVAPAILGHFGVEAPPYARSVIDVA
jgi:hypothetical protein